ncbi:IS3 family transposase, partial [Streptomyces sp. NPDC094438]|uniref:IS3 family transposase n=1 Tax=Streptomyces sp. NPDC094438 TaxID=3366061 RepID=UPI0038225B0D
MKNELVYRTSFPTRAHARRAIVRYIEMFYNHRRLHSGLGYRTPAEVHAEYEELQATAWKSLNIPVREVQGAS